MARSDRALIGLPICLAGGCSALLGADFGDYGPEGDGGAAQSGASSSGMISSATTGDAGSTTAATGGAGGGGDGGDDVGSTATTTVASSSCTGLPEENCATPESESDLLLDNDECGAVLGGSAAPGSFSLVDVLSMARSSGGSTVLVGGELVERDQYKPFLLSGNQVETFQPGDLIAAVRALLPISGGGFFAAGSLANPYFSLGHGQQLELAGLDAEERGAFISRRLANGTAGVGLVRAAGNYTTSTHGWIEALGSALDDGDLLYVGVTDAPIDPIGVFTPGNAQLEGGQYFVGRIEADLTRPRAARIDPESVEAQVCSVLANSKADGLDLAVDGAGGIWIVGGLCGDVSSLPQTAVDDGFIGHLPASGELSVTLRGFGLGTVGRQTLKTVARARDDQVVIGGDFNGELDFAVEGSLLELSSGNDDGFVGACSFVGGSIDCRWGVQLGGAGQQYVRDLLVDADRSVYVLGAFSGETSFGGEVFGSDNVSFGTFVLKLDPDGEAIWVRWFQSPGGDVRPGRLIGRADGGVTASGVFAGDLSLGGDELSSETPTVFLVDIAP